MNVINTKYAQNSIIFKQYGFHHRSVLGKKQGTAPSCSSSSSSSSTTHDRQSWTYDVFLSFRGADTRNNFVGHLHANLVRKGIKTFIDDEELERGDEISNALVRAIQESKISVVVFSENYASSRWCLEELVMILHCKETKQQLVCPVFYKVDPADVRYQRGSFDKSLPSNSEKVKRWREALREASNIFRPHFTDGSNEFEFIDTIVEGISAKLQDRMHLSVAKYPVGIKPRVEDVLKLVRVIPEFEEDGGVSVPVQFQHLLLHYAVIPVEHIIEWNESFRHASSLHCALDILKSEGPCILLGS